MKKVTFFKVKTSLSRNFVYNLQTFRGFCQVHFTVMLNITLDQSAREKSLSYYKMTSWWFSRYVIAAMLVDGKQKIAR